MAKPYENLKLYFGDIHNHCAVGYGHGSLEDSYHNARLQLDFVCVTVHAHWGDMPEGEERLAEVVAYHKDGFLRSREAWPYMQEVVEANYQPGKFVSFLGFEWHSMEHGDRNIVFNGSQGEIIYASTLDELHAGLSRLAEQGIEGFAFAHHIGYKRGYRGINWNTFNPKYSPLVEIISMHGASESNETAYQYLHTMGPRDWQSTYQYGLNQGYLVGAFGSTDHHSAHPGSYGHGRLATWSDALTREGIWDAFKNRRTYALSGDRIHLEFSLNGEPLGSVLPFTKERQVELAIRGGDALDYVEIIYNNSPIYRWNGKPMEQSHQTDEPVLVYVEIGWGERDKNVDWDVELETIGAEILRTEPRFRGPEVVAPEKYTSEECAFSNWERISPTCVRFSTRTWGNPTTTTASTQGIALEISGNKESRIRAVINGKPVEVTLEELFQGSKSGYLGGFLTPAYRFHQAIPERAYTARITYDHEADGSGRDWYYVRVRQKMDSGRGALPSGWSRPYDNKRPWSFSHHFPCSRRSIQTHTPSTFQQILLEKPIM
jgi:hypothetical protein